MPLNVFDEFRGIVQALREAGVDYATVGAIALAVHGAPRATTDIDILVEPGAVDAALVVARRCGFQVEARPIRFSDGMELRRISKFAGEDFLTLDILLVNPNLETIWRSRMDVQTDQGPIRVISRDSLIAMKAAAARTRDLADIERLQDLDR